MNDNELQNRLNAMGRHRIDSVTAEQHRRRIDAASAGGALVGRRRFGPVAVAAAGIVGFLAGSTGLAMAGALPDQAQGVAHDVLGVVQLDVPSGKEGKRGPCVSEAAKIDDEVAKQAAKDACPKGPADKPRTRGSCVSEAAKIDDEVAKQAAKDACPKGRPEDVGSDGDTDAPGRSGEAPGQNKDKPTDGKAEKSNGSNSKHADDPCRGKPPWAGPMSQAERAEAKSANSREDCVDDDLDDATDPAGGADGADD